MAKTMFVLDTHHLLFPRKAWSKSWAKKLRSHPYAKELLRKDITHARIHKHLLGVPVPSETDCYLVYELLTTELSIGLIHENDTIFEKLSFFIFAFDLVAPDTALAMRKQRDIVLGKYDPSE